MTTNKKYYYSDLEKYDNAHNTSFIRLLEMKVDALNVETGYRLQFWKDVKLYGVDEALNYLADVGNSYVRFVELKECWDKQKQLLIASAKKPMQKYRKRPVVIEAVQITNNTFDAPHPNESHIPGIIYYTTTRHVVIQTLEGPMTAHVGDWIIKGLKGELYPCKDEIFKLTYDPE